MRMWWRSGALLLAVLIAGAPALALEAVDPQAIAAFAGRQGLREVAPFVDAVRTLRTAGKLPARYVTKDQARARGWHGGGLCNIWPGHVIGGDVFQNFGRKLPAERTRVYREADLDSTCGERGAKRLVFSDDGLIFVTVDHYNSFAKVP